MLVLIRRAVKHFTLLRATAAVSREPWRASARAATIGLRRRVWQASFVAGNHYAGDFWFRTGNVNPHLIGGRSYGLPVRCVQN